MCPDGAESMLVAAERALDDLPSDDPWRPHGLLLLGTAHVLLGEPERADAIFSRAVHASRRLAATDTLVLALTQRALLANDQAERVRAGQLLDAASEAARQDGVDAYPTTALTLAACARFELLHGHSPEAFSALQRAGRLATALGRCLPWLAVQIRLELAHAYVTLRDPAAAREVLSELDDLLATGPSLGCLARRRDALAAEVRELPSVAAGRSVGLTAAELRLVPMLATHLSFREIGARFFLSRNTVKTQAISVYRKLGASSRSEAVVQATSLGLIDPGADTDSLIQSG
jgi:LuxR family maltose regulon positive regulatory protein